MSIGLREDFPDGINGVGQRLRQLRKARGFSQAELGKLCDPPVSHPAVWKWEHGETSVPASRVMDWARIFGVPVGYFFGEGEEVGGSRAAPTTAEGADEGDAGGDGVADRRVCLVAAESGARDPGVHRGTPLDGVPGVETPPGLAELIESGILMTAEELQALRGYWAWTAQEWLEVLMERRAERLKERLRNGTGGG